MSGGLAERTGPGWAGQETAVLSAPAKLTVTLAVTGVRPDGYHLLESEMVSLDLADRIEISDAEPVAAGEPGGAVDLEVVADWPSGGERWRALSVGPAEENLVSRALAAAGCRARVRLVKRIPPGAGLGGGSSDAAAVLRWAGCRDVAVAAGLGADVPFCVAGGRARVTGIGEEVAPLAVEPRTFVLLLPPFGVDTVAVYRRWDELHAAGALPAAGSGANDLEAAAVRVEPRLAAWKEALEELAGAPARLAGSGSTWFVEVGPGDVPALASEGVLERDGARALVVVAGTVPAAGGSEVGGLAQG